MREYALKRLLTLIPLLFLVSVLTFVTLRIVPGDAAVARAGLSATPEQVAELRRDLGLDQPRFPISFGGSAPFVNLHGDSQYWTWLKNVFQGDLGQSSTYRSPVEDEIIDRAPVTAELMLMAVALTLIIGVPLGVVAAMRRNGPIDYVLRGVSVMGLSVPAFWLGTMLLLFPAIWWGWAPPADYQHIWEAPWHNLRQFALPAVALSTSAIAAVIRVTRASVLDILGNDYVRTAWAKGLRERQVMLRHIVKNAMIPVTSYLGIQLLTLISGAIVIEQLFNLNGLGQLLFTGVFSRDYALVQALVLFTAAVVLIINLLVDLAYGWLDPRIRYT